MEFPVATETVVLSAARPRGVNIELCVSGSSVMMSYIVSGGLPGTTVLYI